MHDKMDDLSYKGSFDSINFICLIIRFVHFSNLYEAKYGGKYFIVVMICQSQLRDLAAIWGSLKILKA